MGFMKRKSFAIRQFVHLLGCLIVVTLLANCGPQQQQSKIPKEASNARVRAVNLRNLVSPEAHDQPVTLTAAKNEWSSFQLHVSGLPALGDKIAYTLRLG